MQSFQITSTSKNLDTQIQHKIDFKTKPVGALGDLEKIALKIGMIQGTDMPELINPTIVVFAGDHGIAKDGVSAYPQEVTYQMVMNFLNHGAAINVFCDQNGIDLHIVDAGVNYDFPESLDLIDAKIAKGTKSYLKEPAMTREQCEKAIKAGADLCDKIYWEDTNIIGFGEMGIGNTSAASLIMSEICGYPLAECVGRGTGLDDERLTRKVEILEKASKNPAWPAGRHDAKTPFEILRAYGGFEMAMMCGAMLKAAENGMIIMVDGFISTSVFLVAHAIAPEIMDYAIFSHQSDEQGHKSMLEFLHADPLLKLGMRLGEGTGCALAYPLIKSSVAFLNDMASFESAGVSQEE